MPHTETARGTIFYTLSQGTADCPTLVLVHGAGGSRLHWPGELRRLPQATVYTLDLPGHGRSEGTGCNTISDYANTVAAFLDALGVERAVIVGHSLGGAIAQTLALDFAARITRMALTATGARLRVAPAIIEGIQSDFEGTAALITRFAWSPD
ncbi:MAG: alpha/beta fold hydrolase, partial [Chloroflexota bacterium]|nr:alpha/beta fold hydrolase [Chloroflexota bacterium]